MDEAVLQVAGGSGMTVNMAGVQELDTLGAWLLERLIRGFRERGQNAGIHRRCRNAFAACSTRCARSNRRRVPLRAQPNRIIAALDRLGRTTVGLQRRHPGVPRDVRRPQRGAARVLVRPLGLSAHLRRASSQSRRLAGDADHPADHLPDRLHHRAAGLLPFPQVRRRCLRGRHGRHPGAARDRRPDRHHHGGRPLRQRLHRRARFHEDARGNRRAAHHGIRSGRSADPAARAGAGRSRCRS